MPSPDYPPIRILHVVGAMNYGGIQKWLLDVLRHIDRERMHMDFLVHTEEPCAYDSEIRALGGRIIPCLNPSNPLSYSMRFSRALQDYGPYDIVHSHLHFFSGLIMRLGHQNEVPIRISHSHLESTLSKDGVRFSRRIYVALMKHWIYRFSTLGLGCSRAAISELFGPMWATDRRWQLLYCGIDLAPFAQKIDPLIVRREFGIPANSPVVGHVGRFEEQKNHAFIIAIAEQIIKIEPRARILLVGDGSLREETERRVKAIGLEENFVFAGFRPDIARLMLGAMDVFLFPSLYEGLGLVVIEAQAAGLPCIISDVVPTEATVVKGMVKRLPLQQPAYLWATEVLAALEGYKAWNNHISPLSSIESSEFNIHTSVRKLSAIYHEAL